MPGKGFVLNLTLQRVSSCWLDMKEESCFYDWLLSSGERGKWSDGPSPIHRVLNISCDPDLRRLIILMAPFISCHDWALKILRPGKGRTGVGITSDVANTLSGSKVTFYFTPMISHLWFVTLAKVTQLDFICQLYLKTLVLCF